MIHGIARILQVIVPIQRPRQAQSPEVIQRMVRIPGKIPIFFPSNFIPLVSDPARALGCHIQQQMCNPNLRKGQDCTPLTSARDPSAASALWPNGTQADLLDWYTGAIAGSARDPWSIVNQLGISALTSRNTLQGGLQIL